MRNFFAVENSSKKEAAAASGYIREYLEKRGCSFTRKSGYLNRNDVPSGTECIITLGGDGTMIRVASETCERGIPIIGVNLGHLGYLTSVKEKEEIPAMLDALIADDYSIENRSMLKGIWEDEDGRHEAVALNEIVIGRKMTLHAVRLRISINGEFLNEYSADGIIIATPTGSTSYNLSAGGPIVEADSDMMVITPVCPHALLPRSIVLTGNNRPKVEVTGGDENGMIVAFDGDVKAQLSIGSCVEIEKASHAIRMIRIGRESFVSNLQKKMEQLQG